MSRAVLLGSLILILVLAGLATLRGAFVALSMPLLVYVLYGFWLSPDRIELQAQREIGAERVPVQTPVKIRVTITNMGPGLEELALQDALVAGLSITDGCNHHLISLARGGTFSFEYTVSGPRGSFPFEGIHIEGGDTLGLIRLPQNLPVSGQLFVLPDVTRVRQVYIRPRRTRAYAGTIPARVGGPGVEFFGVRDYEPGDSPRQINWRVSARHPENLYSNEYQQERVADVGIVLDGRERSNLFGGYSLFEHSVEAAGALADTFLAQGNRVGLLVYSQYVQWTLPGYGKLQRERILHALAGARTGASQVFDGLQYLPTRMFPSESQIVLVSPLVEDDYSTLIQLRARGYQVLVITPDPVSFEQAHLLRGRKGYGAADVELATRIVRMERRLMLGRLQRAGLQVVEWDVARPFEQAVRGSLRRQRQGTRR